MKAALTLMAGVVTSGLLGGMDPAWGHGATATVEKLTTVRITSQYDTGEPIAGGQVAVYRPGDQETPWLTGTTDAAGVFEFKPDDDSGRWEVIVRQAGHGQSIAVDLGATEQIAVSAPTTSLVQRGLMTMAVIWGFVGTALFCARRSP